MAQAHVHVKVASRDSKSQFRERASMSFAWQKPIFAGLVLTACMLSPQTASARYNCEVKVTPDGFVALRDGLSAAGKLIARMKKGEVVSLLHPPDYEKLIRRGSWIFVRYIPGSQFARVNEANHDKAIPGWVNDKLIDCPE